jgi:hypothetical protein
VSRILDKLRAAELQRESVVAEHKRLEAEADAALAARESDASRALSAYPEAPAGGAAQTARGRAAPPASTAITAWMAIGVTLALCLAIGVLYFRQEAQPRPQGVFQLKLDRDLESFAKRVQEKEKP